MAVRMAGCPYCDEKLYHVHETKWRMGWTRDRHDNDVYTWIPYDGPINKVKSVRLRRIHIRACEARVIVEEYGTLRPLDNW